MGSTSAGWGQKSWSIEEILLESLPFSLVQGQESRDKMQIWVCFEGVTIEQKVSQSWRLVCASLEGSAPASGTNLELGFIPCQPLSLPPKFSFQLWWEQNSLFVLE